MAKDAIVGWIYEPGMPVAVPVMYTDDPCEDVLVQVVAPLEPENAGLAWQDEIKQYKDYLRAKAKA